MPDGEPTQADPGVMGVTCQAPAAATARLVCELKEMGTLEAHGHASSPSLITLIHVAGNLASFL